MAHTDAYTLRIQTVKREPDASPSMIYNKCGIFCANTVSNGATSSSHSHPLSSSCNCTFFIWNFPSMRSFCCCCCIFCSPSLPLSWCECVRKSSFIYWPIPSCQCHCQLLVGCHLPRPFQSNKAANKRHTHTHKCLYVCVSVLCCAWCVQCQCT